MTMASRLSMSMSPATKPWLVFLSAHLPSATAREAGQRLAYGNLRALASKWNVSLLSFANDAELETLDATHFAMCSDVHIEPVTTATRIRSMIANPGLPGYVAFRNNRRLARRLRELVGERHPDLAWAEYSQMAQYLPSLSLAGVPSVLVCHDILTQLFARRAAAGRWLTRLTLGAELRRVRHWEAHILSVPVRNVTLSQKDAELVRDLAGVDAGVAFPPVDAPPRSPRMVADPPTVVFYGAMGRSENADAVGWLLDEVWPRVRTNCADARFIVLGANPDAQLRRRAEQTEGVVVTGYVDNPDEWFGRSWISVAPLRLGAGVKIKVIEALARGIPVVATPVGAEGIPAIESEGLIVAPDSASIAQRIIALLSDRRACLRLGQAAHQWFESFYQPRQFSAERVVAFAEEALRLPRAG
jgi:polysaccharide biosynthesis protein PslH